MQVLPENFERGLCWLRDILFNSCFTRDRLKIVVRKLISSISQIRRQGNVIIKDLMKIMIFNSGMKVFILSFASICILIRFFCDRNEPRGIFGIESAKFPITIG